MGADRVTAGIDTRSVAPAQAAPLDHAIVGGGMLGLALAWELAKAGERVTLYEAAPGLGGLSASQDLGDVHWDRFYHCILPSDRDLQTLIAELGLGPELVWRRVGTGVYLDGAVHRFDSAADLLRLPRLPLLAKLRIGMLAATRGGRPSDDELDGTTAAVWLRRRCGAAAFDGFWSHLLRCKLGSSSEVVAARFLYLTIARLAGARSRFGGGERLGYVRGGYRSILARLRERLAERGVRFHVGRPVTAIEPTASGVGVTVGDARQLHRSCVLTVPNPAIPKLVRALDPELASALTATEYLGVLCTVAVGASPVTHAYLLNLCDPGFRITGVVEMSNLARAEPHLGGASLVYLPRYAPAGDPLFEQDDARLEAEAMADLARVNHDTHDGWCRHREVHRARLIQPLPLVGRPVAASPLQPVPGAPLFVVNSAQLPTCVLNNNDVVALARRSAPAVAVAAAIDAGAEMRR